MKAFFALIMLILPFVGLSQTNDIYTYRKGSVCTLLLTHRNLQFAKEIEDAFVKIPVPNKYNDHNLGKKVFYTTEKNLKIKDLDKHKGFIINGQSNQNEMNDFDLLLQKQFVASRMLAKWFNRNKSNGICDMQLITERGYSNSSELEKKLANLSVRKEALLYDAGEELIGSTFVLINDIRYIEKGKIAKVAGEVVNIAVDVYMTTQGNSNYDNSIGDIISSFKGFNVKINTYLYQLIWDEHTEKTFYKKVYTEKQDEEKRKYFESHRGDYSIKYLGMQESSGKDISFVGINDNEPEVMVLKACQRAFDENVANLQKNFEVFKIKAPLLSVEPLTCEIGLKEGVSPDSKFEVLEVVEDEKGHVEYKRKGIIRPEKNKIWDNRFMAKEEGAENADLGFTTFTKVSGSGFYPGMLVREIK